MKKKITENDHFKIKLGQEQDLKTTVLDDSQSVEKTDGEQFNRNNEDVD